MGEPLSPEQLDHISQLSVTDALVQLTNIADVEPLTIVRYLADCALEQAEAAPDQAAHWLRIGSAYLESKQQCPAHEESNVANEKTCQAVEAQILYATARLYVQAGELGRAELTLRNARKIWEEISDLPSLTRSTLGLTQILAMQGRYAEAEKEIQSAIQTYLSFPQETDTRLALADAYHNLATLLRFQERHAESLTLYAQAQELFELILNETDTTETEFLRALQNDLAHIGLNSAHAHMYLDSPQRAEDTLEKAMELFTQIGDNLNRGRASTNLGSLYLRTGQYALALKQFDSASVDLMLDHDSNGNTDLERLHQADMLLLDQAIGYIALNLLTEASVALTRCEELFRQADMPYELGQCLYTTGLFYIHSGDHAASHAALSEAQELFARLDNRYWLNRTRLALAGWAYRYGELEQAKSWTQQLIEDLSSEQVELPISSEQSTTESTATLNKAAPLVADIGMRIEIYLLWMRICLGEDKIVAAREAVATVACLIQPTDSDGSTSSLPHLQLRLAYAFGQIECFAGNWSDALSYLSDAVDLMENQRATFPLEEIRAAYLDDKSSIYSDFVFALLAQSGGAPNTVAQIFEVIERSRSRALLERLSTTIDEIETLDTPLPESVPDPSTETLDNAPEVLSDSTHQTISTQRATARQQLHWLYGRLLGENGGQFLDANLMQQIQRQEISWVVWRCSLPLFSIRHNPSRLQHSKRLYKKANKHWSTLSPNLICRVGPILFPTR
ncbi:tetratricopeptide repeat protein [Chloroflexi bacterium TSY]|nr:tetratricopeptide repeat protein [Chloroflexi bacterium TSY]